LGDAFVFADGGRLGLEKRVCGAARRVDGGVEGATHETLLHEDQKEDGDLTKIL